MELDNLVLQHIDQEAHRMLTELRQKSDDIGSSKAFQSVDSSLFPSHFMLNCMERMKESCEWMEGPLKEESGDCMGDGSL
jgi:hypothetical protein